MSQTYHFTPILAADAALDPLDIHVICGPVQPIRQATPLAHGAAMIESRALASTRLSALLSCCELSDTMRPFTTGSDYVNQIGLETDEGTEPQVTEVISVDSSTAAPLRPPRKSSRSPLGRQPLEANVQEMGTVKWYNVAKGFGFIVRDGGGKDVFGHVSALDRAGIMGLNEGQRVFVGVAEGQKGPEAASIQLA
jgi:cold shock CspA family protein